MKHVRFPSFLPFPFIHNTTTGAVDDLNLSKGLLMKVLCTSKGGDSLMDSDIKAGNTRHSVFQITTNHEYTVYGVLFSGGTVSYLVQGKFWGLALKFTSKDKDNKENFGVWPLNLHQKIKTKR